MKLLLCHYLRKCIIFLRKHKYYTLSLVLALTMIEFPQAIWAALHYPLNTKKHFNFFNLNPQQITPEQAEKAPILLLHANLYNQSGWLALAKSLKEADVGPVFTVNLPSGDCTEKDRMIIDNKLREIRALYLHQGKKKVKTHLIGHSRGACAAYLSAWPPKKTEEGVYINRHIGKVISMGSNLDQQELFKILLTDKGALNRIYEINGIYDPLFDRSIVTQHYAFRTAHVGLLFSSTIHRQVLNCLKSEFPS